MTQLKGFISLLALSITSLSGMELPISSISSPHMGDVPETTSANQELFHAIKDEIIADVISLLSHADLDAHNGFGRTPLHWAVEVQNPLLVHLLLIAGAPLNDQDDNGSSALHLAAEFGDIKIVQELLSRPGTFVNSRDVSGRTPLHYAVLQEDPHVVRALIAARTIIDAQDIDGATPLHDAAAYGTQGILQALIQSIPPAALDKTDNRGRTPLLVALENGNRYAVSLLLALGAQINATDNEGTSALEYAIGYPDKAKALEMLQQIFRRKDLIIPSDLTERIVTMTDDQDIIMFILQRIRDRELRETRALRQQLGELKESIKASSSQT